MIWGGVISAVADIAGGYLKGKQEKAVAKQKLEVAKIEAQTTKALQDGEWENEAIKATDNSWKDELWTVFFVLLIGACFVPAAQPYIEDGFRFLREDCPEWLSWGILASIAASFGLKSIGQFKK